MSWLRFRVYALTPLLASALLLEACASEPRVSFQEAREIRLLVNSLATDDDAVFLRISRTLVEKGSKAVPFLISELRLNPDPNIRHQVARVIAQIRDDRGRDALFQASQLDPDQTVRAIAKVSLDGLLELLGASQPGVRLAQDYKRFSRLSIFSLRRTLRGERNASIRQRAAQALGEYGDERELKVLFEAAKRDPVPEVRREAVWAIVKIGYPVVLGGEYRVTFYGTLTYEPDSLRGGMVRELTGLLEQERDASVRLEVVKGLTRLAYPAFLVGEGGSGRPLTLRAGSREVILRVRDCFIWLLRRDESPMVRKEAAASLSKLFMSLFDRGDRVSSEEIRRSLLTEKRSYSFYPYLSGRVGYFRRRTFDYFPSRAESLLKPVREALSDAYSSDPDPAVRKEAVVGLSFLGDKSDSRTILAHLRSERNADLWLSSIEALGQLGGESAAEALLSVYRGRGYGPELRKAAVISIGTIGNKKAIRDLANSIASEQNREVKLAMLEAMGRQKDEQTADVLMEACRDKDAQLRAAAARAAGQNFTDGAAPVLKELLQKDPEEKVRAAACASLSKILGKEAAGLLVAALKDRGSSVRRTAAVELGLRKLERSVDVLAAALLSDPDASVRAEVATSLGNLGGQKSIHPLIYAIARDWSPVVREHALEALLKTDQPRAAIIAILAELSALETGDRSAYVELSNAMLYLRQQAHGREIGQR